MAILSCWQVIKLSSCPAIINMKCILLMFSWLTHKFEAQHGVLSIPFYSCLLHKPHWFTQSLSECSWLFPGRSEQAAGQDEGSCRCTHSGCRKWGSCPSLFGGMENPLANLKKKAVQWNVGWHYFATRKFLLTSSWIFLLDFWICF